MSGDSMEMLISTDVHKPCGCRVFADSGQLWACPEHQGCQHCKRGGWDGVILADSEDWKWPACIDCYERFGGKDPDA